MHADMGCRECGSLDPNRPTATLQRSYHSNCCPTSCAHVENDRRSCRQGSAGSPCSKPLVEDILRHSHHVPIETILEALPFVPSDAWAAVDQVITFSMPREQLSQQPAAMQSAELAVLVAALASCPDVLLMLKPYTTCPPVHLLHAVTSIWSMSFEDD